MGKWEIMGQNRKSNDTIFSLLYSPPLSSWELLCFWNWLEHNSKWSCGLNNLETTGATKLGILAIKLKPQDNILLLKCSGTSFLSQLQNPGNLHSTQSQIFASWEVSWNSSLVLSVFVFLKSNYLSYCDIQPCPIGQKSEQQVVEMTNKLCDKLLNGKEQHRDVASISLKIIISEIPTSSIAQSVLLSISPQHIKGITDPVSSLNYILMLNA